MNDDLKEALRDELLQAAAAVGLQVQEKGDGHFQITGGKVMVNYYPFSKNSTAHADGAKSGIRRCGIRQALNLARRNLEPEEMQASFQRKPGERHDPVARVRERELAKASDQLPPPWA